MSTILQALQKSKLDQAIHSTPMVSVDNKLHFWKVAISLAMLVIIFLLSTLIYLQLNPQNKALQVLDNNTKLIPLTEQKKIVKVIFDTQPIAPIVPIVPTPEKIITAVKVESAIMPLENKTQQVINEAKIVDNDGAMQELDYDQVPSELKRRFELATLLTEMEKEDINLDQSNDYNEINNVIDDGSDIRQMNSTFQQSVPVMLYDAHMYSSVIADRWIRINGETLKEGQFDSSGKIELIEIQPQRSIFRLQRQSFSLESLTDWKGY